MLTVQPCTLMVLFGHNNYVIKLLITGNIKQTCQIWQVNPTLHADRLFRCDVYERQAVWVFNTDIN